MRALARALFLVPLCGCSLTKDALPLDPPPLADLEEPLDLRGEPDDDAARQALPAGAFTGLTVADARKSLSSLADEEGSLEVASVVENSPADVAGVEPGDLIVEARAAGTTSTPHWPAEWRAIELAARPGDVVTLVVDRAGVDRTFALTVTARARPAAREVAQRFREEDRAGVVVRTATEVEARAAGLAPGGGAVVVGLSAASPWRRAGVRYGDLVAAADGVAIAHPEVLLDVLRKAPPGGPVELTIVRGAQRAEISVALTRRAEELRSFELPLVLSYRRERGLSTTSLLFGLVRAESTRAAWKLRLLWYFEISGGDADRLEVDHAR